MTVISISLSFLLTFFTGAFSSQTDTTFDKETYYKVFASKDLTLISGELKSIQSADFAEKDAFEGALLMKKASLLSSPKDKLSTFKAGHSKLEQAIHSNSNNTEYRFLRLMIQENAPKFLGYNKEIDSDKKNIVSNYKSLPTVVKQAIVNYSKTSSVLTPESFQ